MRCVPIPELTAPKKEDVQRAFGRKKLWNADPAAKCQEEGQKATTYLLEVVLVNQLPERHGPHNG